MTIFSLTSNNYNNYFYRIYKNNTFYYNKSK